MAMAVSADSHWLQGAPHCRTEGSKVHVTLALEPGRANNPVCIAWSADGLHATTPMVKGSSVTCYVPRGVFDRGALMRVQVIGLAETESLVFAWTQIPVLEETMFRAEMVWGRPVLLPPMPHPVQAASRPALSCFD
jgi:hypothetical protein